MSHRLINCGKRSAGCSVEKNLLKEKGRSYEEWEVKRQTGAPFSLEGPWALRTSHGDVGCGNEERDAF